MTAAASEPSNGRDALKRVAAQEAVELVEDGMVVGLGTGTTAAFAVETPRPAASARIALRWNSHL